MRPFPAGRERCGKAAERLPHPPSGPGAGRPAPVCFSSSKKLLPFSAAAQPTAASSALCVAISLPRVAENASRAKSAEAHASGMHEASSAARSFLLARSKSLRQRPKKQPFLQAAFLESSRYRMEPMVFSYAFYASYTLISSRRPRATEISARSPGSGWLLIP